MLTIENWDTKKTYLIPDNKQQIDDFYHEGSSVHLSTGEILSFKNEADAEFVYCTIIDFLR